MCSISCANTFNCVFHAELPGEIETSGQHALAASPIMADGTVMLLPVIKPALGKSRVPATGDTNGHNVINTTFMCPLNMAPDVNIMSGSTRIGASVNSSITSGELQVSRSVYASDGGLNNSRTFTSCTWHLQLCFMFTHCLLTLKLAVSIAACQMLIRSFLLLCLAGRSVCHLYTRRSLITTFAAALVGFALIWMVVFKQHGKLLHSFSTVVQDAEV